MNSFHKHAIIAALAFAAAPAFAESASSPDPSDAAGASPAAAPASVAVAEPDSSSMPVSRDGDDSANPADTAQSTAAAEQKSKVVDAVVAYVNNDAITFSDVAADARDILRMRPERFAGHKDAETEAFNEALEALIDMKLVLQAYEDGPGRIPDWAVDSRISEIIDDNFGGNRANLMKQLAKDRLTLAEWRDSIERNLIISSMHQAYVNANVYIAPSRIMEYYNTHQDEFQKSESARVAFIAVTLEGSETDIGAKLDEATRAISEGADFVDVARKYSSNLSLATTGAEKWIVPDTDLREELVAAIKPLKVGEVSKPVQLTPALYYIAKLVDKKSGDVEQFDEVSDAILRKLTAQERERLRKEWLGHLREKAAIRVLPFPQDL